MFFDIDAASEIDSHHISRTSDLQRFNFDRLNIAFDAVDLVTKPG